MGRAVVPQVKPCLNNYIVMAGVAFLLCFEVVYSGTGLESRVFVSTTIGLFE